MDTCVFPPAPDHDMRDFRASHYPIDRRTFLVAGGLGFFGANLAHGFAHAASGGEAENRKIAKSAIMIWLSGGRLAEPSPFDGVLAGLATGPTLIHHDGRQHGLQLGLTPSGATSSGSR